MDLIENSLKMQLLDILHSHPKSYALVLKSAKCKALLKFIFEQTQGFELDLNTRIYWTLNGLKAFPKCKICKVNDIPHNRKCHPLNGYYSYACSHSCAQKDPVYRKQLEERCLKKYGVKHVQQTAQYKNGFKAKLASLSKSHWKTANSKRRKTCIEKFGVDNVSKNKDVHSKSVSSLNETFSKNKDQIIAKTKQTKLERYNDQNYVNADKARQTRKQKKLADRNYAASIADKKKCTCLERYGVAYACNLQTAKDHAKAARRKKQFESFINSNVQPLFSLDEYIASNNGQKLRWKCKLCGNEFESNVYMHQNYIARCTKCFPLHSSTSSEEKNIAQMLEQLGFKTLCSSRKIIPPQEIDIYIPEKKLAIEYDGLYWHSNNMNTSKTYYLDKSLKCEAQGIQLVHIFENEWLCKQDIVKSRLKNLLGVYDKAVYARKCEVREVDSKTSKEFQEANHLQGAINSKVSLGLYDGEELVSLMTFGKCRFDKKHEWEMLRFCNKLGYHVPGAAGKLLKHFEKAYNPRSIVSYADRRWSQGKLYKALGFKLSHASSPNYWYWNYKCNSQNLQSRLMFQKHKLPKLLKSFDPALSEYENMRNNGYLRIFDCGNLVFEKYC